MGSVRGTLARSSGNERDAPKIGIGGHLAVPSLPHQRAYGSLPGGSTRLSLVRNMKSRETERVEVVVAQGLLDRRVSGHAPETGRRTGGDRRMELGYPRRRSSLKRLC